MRNRRLNDHRQLFLIALVAASLSSCSQSGVTSQSPSASHPADAMQAGPSAKTITSKDFLGPRGNVEADAPTEAGFNTFAVVIPGVLSRSGQPSLSEFQWLKDHGWKGDVDLRISGDHNESANDQDMHGFLGLGFHYLWLQIVDLSTPTDDQAKQFLDFVTNPANQPVEVHCLAGVGRTGVMVALYRYQVQGWPMDQAIAESRLFEGGVDTAQEAWLNTWAAEHPTRK